MTSPEPPDLAQLAEAARDAVKTCPRCHGEGGWWHGNADSIPDWENCHMCEGCGNVAPADYLLALAQRLDVAAALDRGLTPEPPSDEDRLWRHDPSRTWWHSAEAAGNPAEVSMWLRVERATDAIARGDGPGYPPPRRGLTPEPEPPRPEGVTPEKLRSIADWLDTYDRLTEKYLTALRNGGYERDDANIEEAIASVQAKTVQADLRSWAAALAAAEPPAPPAAKLSLPFVCAGCGVAMTAAEAGAHRCPTPAPVRFGDAEKLQARLGSDLPDIQPPLGAIVGVDDFDLDGPAPSPDPEPPQPEPPHRFIVGHTAPGVLHAAFTTGWWWECSCRAASYGWASPEAAEDNALRHALEAVNAATEPAPPAPPQAPKVDG